ncbi:hypothetical protein JCM14036_29630 [Desulfotomaculum defluvii]
MTCNKNTMAIITDNRIENQCTDIIYPQVSGLKNQVAQQKINDAITRIVQRQIPQEGCEVYAEIYGRYEVEVNKNGILSIKFNFYTIRHMAANGLDVQKSITANLETGEIYQLHDLFKSNSHYRVTLNRIIDQQIKEKDINLLTPFPGVSDYDEYYLTEDSLVLYWQELEYTAHYLGTIEFVIPYIRIRNIISEDGPIGILLCL